MPMILPTSTSTQCAPVPALPKASPEPSPSQELVLLIFIHGFKGTDSSFEQFPNRLEHLLAETIPGIRVECVTFPAYETKGDLDKAVIQFADWLTTRTTHRENDLGLGSGSVKIVLCGHSMGGLLAADSLREFVNTRPDRRAPLWPNIIACIAYDTPYFGLNPFVVKNTATKIAEYANTAVGSAIMGSLAGFTAQKAAQPAAAQTPSPSLWRKWAPAAYAIGGAVLAGGAYYKRDDLTQGLTWATDHLKYVGNLWDEAALAKRVEDLVDIEKDHGVVFRTLYTVLPPNPPEFLTSRTFVVLPKYQSRAKNHFIPTNNGIAANEIEGHRGMFSASTNDGYYQLGLTSANLIRDAVMISKGEEPSPPPSKPSAEKKRLPTEFPTESKSRNV